MSEQLSLSGIAPTEPAVAGAERFAECRRRVSDGCGGHHSQGALWHGAFVRVWVCCGDCPNRDEFFSFVGCK